MKILVLGAGAIGGYFGGRLVQAGADVTFLVRPKRKEQLQVQGLRIASPFGDATLTVDARLQSDIGPDYDLVMLTCKAYDLHDAIESIAPAMAGSAGVLPLLNGIAHLAVLNDCFGADRVLGGAARIAVSLDAEGVIRHLNDWRTLTFGEQDGKVSQRAILLQEILTKGGVEAKLSTNIWRDLWWKLVHLHTIAAMTSLMRANVGEIVRTPAGKELFRRVMDTNIEIAGREGFAPDDMFIETYRGLFEQADSTYEASLLRDIERGGPIESEHILGFMLERSKAHGLPNEVHQLAYTAAKAYEQRRTSARLPLLRVGNVG